MTAITRTRVGDLAEQVRGVSYGKEDASRIPQEGYLPVLRAGNITNEGLVFDDLVYVPSTRISRRQLVQKGDVVIAASSGSLDVVGKAAPAASAFNGGFGAFCKVLRPRANVDAAFFAHFFKTGDYRRKISSLAAGANINNLKNEHLDDLEIPLPPLPEQRRIAAILDQAETLRTQRRAALAHLDSLTQSLFLDMFGDPVTNAAKWTACTLGEIAKQKPNNGIFRKNSEYIQSEDEGLPVVWLDELFKGNTINTRWSRRVVPTARDIENYGLKTGDLLFCRSSLKLDGIAFNNVYVGIDNAALFECHLIRISPNLELVSPTFIHHLLRLPQMRAMIKTRAKTSTMTTIDQQGLCAVAVIAPPLPLQQTFATRVQAIEALKEKHRTTLTELDALFASLQHRAFNGELSAQAPTQPKPRRFTELGQLDTSKGLEALVYAAHRLPNKGHYWPLKVQYVADRRHLERHGRTLYGETHVAMPYGPVPQAAFNASRALANGELLCELPMDAVRAALRRDGDALVALRDADPGVLGADERESLDWAIRLVADMSFDELKNQTHDSAWEKTPRNAPMAWQDIIATLAPAAQQRLRATFE